MIAIINDKLHDDNDANNCTCVLCCEMENQRKNNGKIFRDLYVCEECIAYIAKLDLDDTSA